MKKFPKPLAFAGLLLALSSIALGVDTPTRLTNAVIIGNGVAGTKTLTYDIGGSNPLIESVAGVLKLSTNGTNLMSVPAATDTFVGKATTDSLTNKTIGSGGLPFTGSSSGSTLLQPSATASGTLTLPAATDTLVGKATTDVLTNKTLTGNTAVNLISGSGTLTLNTTGTITVPNATDTLVAKTTTDTMTNKTLTSPALTSPAITGAWTTTGDQTHTTSGSISTFYNSTGTATTNNIRLQSGNGTTSGNNNYIEYASNASSQMFWDVGQVGSQDFSWSNQTAGFIPMVLSSSSTHTATLTLGSTAVNAGSTVLSVIGDTANGSGPFITRQTSAASAPAGSDNMQVMNYTNGGTTTTGIYIKFQKAGSAIGNIAQNASATVAYNTSSDARLKHDIEDYAEALDDLRAMHIRKFRWNDGDQEDRGVIAQETKPIYPYAVQGNPGDDVNDRPMSVDYGKLSPMALGAAKIIDQNVVALTAVVMQLKSDFEAYKAAHPDTTGAKVLHFPLIGTVIFPVDQPKAKKAG